MKKERKDLHLGEERRGPGRPQGPRPKADDLRRLYVQEGRSIREIAGILGVKRDTVRRSLINGSIERRLNAKRSRLRAFSIDEIERAVQGHTMKDAAAILGVATRTLQYYRAGHRANTSDKGTAIKASKPRRHKGKTGK
jgi:DNA-binding CsgD family transcriptional regulator